MPANLSCRYLLATLGESLSEGADNNKKGLRPACHDRVVCLRSWPLIDQTLPRMSSLSPFLHLVNPRCDRIPIN